MEHRKEIMAAEWEEKCPDICPSDAHTERIWTDVIK